MYGIPGHWPGYFQSCILISQEPDAKTPYRAYACLRIKCGIAKSYLSTHTALQAPMTPYPHCVNYMYTYVYHKCMYVHILRTVF